MNERIQELAKQCWEEDGVGPAYLNPEKFAELIVGECIDLLRQEWYKLNNLPPVLGESPRDIGLRVGKKGEIVALIQKIKQHFEVEL